MYLSAAFDTVDHNIFLARLNATFGIKDTAIEWLSSYLRNSNQQMSVNGTLFKYQNLEYGVPQGSVLGGLMYITYVYDLSKTICRHNVKYQSYADDTHIYMHCDRDEAAMHN